MATKEKCFGGLALASISLFVSTQPFLSFLSHVFHCPKPLSFAIFFPVTSISTAKSFCLFHLTVPLLSITILISALILWDDSQDSNGNRPLLRPPHAGWDPGNRNGQESVENREWVSFQVCTRTFRATAASHNCLRSLQKKPRAERAREVFMTLWLITMINALVAVWQMQSLRYRSSNFLQGNNRPVAASGLFCIFFKEHRWNTQRVFQFVFFQIPLKLNE